MTPVWISSSITFSPARPCRDSLGSFCPEREGKTPRSPNLPGGFWMGSEKAAPSGRKGSIDCARRSDGLRAEETFFDPQVLVRGQSALYSLLSMASLAYAPASFTFNTFTHPGLTSLGHMMKFADDGEANPFLGFFKTGQRRFYPSGDRPLWEFPLRPRTSCPGRLPWRGSSKRPPPGST